MSPVVLDTDVASAILKERLPGSLARRLGGQLRGRSRPVNDSWVAACCLARELPLAILNIRDYTDFAEYEGLELIR